MRRIYPPKVNEENFLVQSLINSGRRNFFIKLDVVVVAVVEFDRIASKVRSSLELLKRKMLNDKTFGFC